MAMGLALGMMVLLMSVAASEMKLEETMKGGKISARTWKDENGATVTSPEGYAYITYHYSGSSVTEKYYTEDGQFCETLGGYASRTLTYGNKHRLTEVEYFGLDGKRKNNAAGYARVKMGYTSIGQVTHIYYYDENNNAVIPKGLEYASVVNTYRGSAVTSRAWAGINKKPVNLSAGYATMTQRVSKKNIPMEIKWEASDGSAVMCAAGWSILDYDLDKQNRPVSARYLDGAGNPVNNSAGYAVEWMNYEGESTVLISRTDAEGAAVPMGESYETVRRETDAEGRLIRESYLNASGVPTINAMGVYATHYGYDDQGRMVSVTLEDEEGNAMTGSEGWAGYLDTLDERGFLTSRLYLNEGDTPTQIAAGYTEIQYSRNEAGQITDTAYMNLDGNRVF